ncbi:MAG: NusG domain II-containing protein [Thermanaerothrix sp.]|nr:NusG domain II-containing protein [Thermanaerothrix sp.]
MRKLDRWVAALIILVCLGALAARRVIDRTAGTATLEISSPTLQRVIPLDGSFSGTIRIEAPDGGFNVVEVRGKTARVLDADCPDRLCVKQGWLSKAGDQAVCLPHRLVVRVRGDRGEDIHGISQ